MSNQSDHPNYDVSKIQVVPFPEAQDRGDGWWSVVWRVATEPADPPRGLSTPNPFPRLAGATCVVTVVALEPGNISIELLTRHRQLIGEEVAFVSLLLQRIARLFDRVTIDGHVDHPILSMARER